jgi:Uma2 family endonuclease
MVETNRWSDEQLLALPEGFKYEIVDGELIVTAANLGHEELISQLIQRLGPFANEHGFGVVAGSNAGFWMTNENFRSPDVAFIRMERVREYYRIGRPFLDGAPDLATEVLSPSDSMAKLRAKAAEYIANGARLVWLATFTPRSIVVVVPGKPERTLLPDDNLDGGAVLPGFRVRVGDLFDVLSFQAGNEQ